MRPTSVLAAPVSLWPWNAASTRRIDAFAVVPRHERPLCGELVFVQQSTEPVVPTEAIEPQSVICRRCFVFWRCVRERWPLAEGTMRPMRVVVLDVGAQDVLKLAAADDQQPVQALPPQAPDP